METNNTRLVPLILLFGWSQNKFRISVSIVVAAEQLFLSPRCLNIKKIISILKYYPLSILLWAKNKNYDCTHTHTEMVSGKAHKAAITCRCFASKQTFMIFKMLLMILRILGCSLVVEWLPDIRKALGSIPSIEKYKRLFSGEEGGLK